MVRLLHTSRLLFVITFFLVSFCTAAIGGKRADAAQFSGEYLIKVCMMDRQGNETVRGGKIACQAYISGVIDYHNTMKDFQNAEDMKGMRYCIPKETTLNEIQWKVLGYLVKHQKMHRKFVAAPGVAMALFAAYPCGK